MRYLSAAFVLTGALALGAPALARDIYLPNQTPDQLKAVCDKVGGKFSQDTSGFECGTDCHGKPGTDCTVFCKEGQKCAVQVIGGRRVHNVESALQAPAKRAR